MEFVLLFWAITGKSASSYLLSFAKLGHKAGCMGHSVRLELTSSGLIALLANITQCKVP